MSAPNDIQIRVARPPFRADGVDFAFFRADHVGLITWVERDPSVETTGDRTRLSADAAQRLMDDLWDAGVRPAEGAGSAGQLAATVRHLEDMRTLVFK